MNISAKTEYACIAVFELAVHAARPSPLRIKDIAGKHGIPARFLVQILLQLKNAGLVTSVRGASGGYRLSKAPEEISLLEVMSVIEGGNRNFVSSAGETTAISKTLGEHWGRISDIQEKELQRLDFQTLVDSIQIEPENMYYI